MKISGESRENWLSMATAFGRQTGIHDILCAFSGFCFVPGAQRQQQQQQHQLKCASVIYICRRWVRASCALLLLLLPFYQPMNTLKSLKPLFGRSTDAANLAKESFFSVGHFSLFLFVFHHFIVEKKLLREKKQIGTRLGKICQRLKVLLLLLPPC